MSARERRAGVQRALTSRELNRATLSRQLLLERADLSALAAVEHLIGLQAQIPAVPYLALWNRLEAFDPAELAHLLRSRAVVRMALMRATIHLVSAPDAAGLRALFDSVLLRTFAGTAWSKRIDADDVEDVLAAATALLDEEPLSRAALGRRLHESFPGVDAETLGMLATYRMALVQPTPRGLWGESGQAVWTSLRAWVGPESLDRAPTIRVEDALFRYLAAHGPASVKDAQAWCGLTRLREVADALGGRLRRYRGPDGAELLDLANAELPDPDEPAPPRFLPEYDNALLGYADRSRVVADAPHVPLMGGPGGFVGTLLVDGLVSGTWALRRERDVARLQVRPSLPLSAGADDDIHAEGVRLLELLAPASRHDIEVGPDVGTPLPM